jgi:hypothetical protein
MTIARVEPSVLPKQNEFKVLADWVYAGSPFCTLSMDKTLDLWGLSVVHDAQPFSGIYAGGFDSVVAPAPGTLPATAEVGPTGLYVESVPAVVEAMGYVIRALSFWSLTTYIFADPAVSVAGGSPEKTGLLVPGSSGEVIQSGGISGFTWGVQGATAISVSGGGCRSLEKIGGEAVSVVLCALRLEGVPDLDVPISSFQVTIDEGGSRRLQVVVPSLDQAEGIADRAGGEIAILQRFVYSGGGQRIFEIARVPISGIRIDEGSVNKSITLYAAA